MGTIISALQSVSLYPIPTATVESALSANGLSGSDEATESVLNSSAFKRAKSSVYMFLSIAPNISQGGVSFSFTAKEKDMFRRMASELLAEADSIGGECFGWMGEDF